MFIIFIATPIASGHCINTMDAAPCSMLVVLLVFQTTVHAFCRAASSRSLYSICRTAYLACVVLSALIATLIASNALHSMCCLPRRSCTGKLAVSTLGSHCSVQRVQQQLINSCLMRC
eukprot:GHRQ01029185.1.p2 GENE.GHRQ01029185.1~~GHRQ01029185.1.p2  ORF type:complete len:118 (-),score=19.27 GHRQ01029185.1:347-700(-)